MNLLRQLSNNPAIVAVIVAMIFALGTLSATNLPIQLLPSIDRPQLGVRVGWRAASPQEMESEIIAPIERELRGMRGLVSLDSSSGSGGAGIDMEFALGTNMDQAFTEATSRLQRVRNLPNEADRPRIHKSGGGRSNNSLIFLFVQQLPNAQISERGMKQFVDQAIAPRLEAIEGVGGLDINETVGEKRIEVVIDPYAVAQLGITVDQIVQKINRSNDVSGGKIGVGRRDYVLMFEGRYSLENLKNIIVEWRDGAPIMLENIAIVRYAPAKNSARITYQNGNPALGIRVLREPGANSLRAIRDVKALVAELNVELERDYGLKIEKSFDPSIFIERALSLLSGNLVIGMLLAIGVLWLFMRNLRATFIIAFAIPICLMTTIIILNLFGRTINVISLAGLAFATGMVLDAAIVVLENFVRLREAGERAKDACIKAVEQVGGALFASTATTVVIFVPIVFFEDVEGQLFADLALTIAIAVTTSFFVAVLVLPVAARLFLRDSSSVQAKEHKLWQIMCDVIMRFTRNGLMRLAIIASLIVGPVAITYALWPQLNYLPPVKRDAVDGFISFPSGARTDLIKEEFVEVIVERLNPYLVGEKEPVLRNYYFFTAPWGSNIGVRIKDQSRIQEMVDIVNNEILAGFPDVSAFAQQGNLFGGFGGSGSVRLDLFSSNYRELGEAAIDIQQLLKEAIPGVRVRTFPDPQVVTPQIRLIPNDRRIAEVGLTRAAVARHIRAFGDGLWLGEFFHEERRVDIVLKGNDLTQPEQLAQIPISTPSGAVIPIGDLMTIERNVGPSQIRRSDGQRTIAINISPPDDIALSTAVSKLKNEIEPKIRALLPADGVVRYGGEADSLKRAISNLSGNFILAVILLFMVMAALFKSMRDALVVIITLPMAAVGGVLFLRGVNLISPTPLDLLGMIGFIILLGLVVNNAILLVAETRKAETEGLDRSNAVHHALKRRIRPILMSTSTSIMGMLPLMIAPGAGSAIYKGLATVIVGGMTLSTIFTLILLPSLLQLQLPHYVARLFGKSDDHLHPASETV